MPTPSSSRHGPSHCGSIGAAFTTAVNRVISSWSTFWASSGPDPAASIPTAAKRFIVSCSLVIATMVFEIRSTMSAGVSERAKIPILDARRQNRR
jgi:hypothetical protein